jgi:glucosamine--fructose-6-phosphate aminotransferase (isomerizing)
MEIPRYLRETLEKSSGECERLVRQVRWGEGPIYLCGCGAGLPAGVAGAYLFEWLAGWPALARSASVFEAYTILAARPRSVLLVISASGENPEALETARLARSRGLLALAVTRQAESSLAGLCEGIILTREEGAEDSAATALCQFAALSRLALTVARLLKPARTGQEELEEELKRLPEQMEWSFTHLADALRSLAELLRAAPRWWLVGGGLYHPVVVRAAPRLQAGGETPGEGIEASQFGREALPQARRGELALFVSGSRLRIKRKVHEAAAQAKTNGLRLLALTDSNDRGLSDRAEMAILAPAQSEVGGALLALALLEWLAVERTRSARR